RGGADAVHDAAHAVSFVVVGAGADDQDVLASRGADAAERTDVTLEGGPGEAGHLGGGDGGDRVADELGRLAPAAAESEGEVVLLDAGEPRDVGGSTGCDLERVGVRSVEGVVVNVGHGSTLWSPAAGRR